MRFALIGASVASATLAQMLLKEGHRVDLFESRPLGMVGDALDPGVSWLGSLEPLLEWGQKADSAWLGEVIKGLAFSQDWLSEKVLSLGQEEILKGASLELFDSQARWAQLFQLLKEMEPLGCSKRFLSGLSASNYLPLGTSIEGAIYRPSCALFDARQTLLSWWERLFDQGVKLYDRELSQLPVAGDEYDFVVLADDAYAFLTGEKRGGIHPVWRQHFLLTAIREVGKRSNPYSSNPDGSLCVRLAPYEGSVIFSLLHPHQWGGEEEPDWSEDEALWKRVGLIWPELTQGEIYHHWLQKIYLSSDKIPCCGPYSGEYRELRIAGLGHRGWVWSVMMALFLYGNLWDLKLEGPSFFKDSSFQKSLSFHRFT